MYDKWMAEILLDNILLVMQDQKFGKDLSAHIVGGTKKLERLIEEGKITAEKPCNAQNGKWYCNASEVLRHCRCMQKKSKKNKR